MAYVAASKDAPFYGALVEQKRQHLQLYAGRIQTLQRLDQRWKAMKWARKDELWGE